MRSSRRDAGFRARARGAAPPCRPRLRRALPGPGVDGVEARHLDPAFWVARANAADRVYLDADAVAAQNARLERLDPTMHDLERLPAGIPRATVRDWIERMSRRPDEPMYDERGTRVRCRGPRRARRRNGAGRHSRAPAAALRSRRAPRESAPLSVARSRFRGTGRHRHRSIPGKRRLSGNARRDRRTRAATAAGGSSSRRTTPRGSRRPLSRKDPPTRSSATSAATRYLVVTGARAFTVHTEDRPEVSELQLDMGVRLPLVADWPVEKPVNGQMAHAGWVVELPVRGTDGALAFAPALLPRTADVQGGLPPAHARGAPRPGLQVPRRALRLGPRQQRARLQRLRRRGLPQLRRAAAARIHATRARARARPHRVQRRRPACLARSGTPQP